ncbi:TonB-dependent receptor [Compostibacter hankyongensis]|uniref:TonB-dependent receptor n=2 Tax=Compostibacter hankyongensis TaxID=1007089 RepID=A0ABP8FLD4_9BACT
MMQVKLIPLLLLVGCLQVTARGYGQQVTLSAQDASLFEVFKSLRQQTGYLFVYDLRMITEAKKVSLTVKDAPLDQVLSMCFRNQPLTYAIVDQTVVVREKTVGSAAPPDTLIDIQARVTNEKGEPLPGVTVTVKGTASGAVTDDKGTFALKDIGEHTTLLFTSIGYKNKEVSARRDFPPAIVLSASASGLDEIVVVGYGTQKKKDLTGAISSLNVTRLENEHPATVQDALRANVSGLNIGFNASAKGGGSLQIRGRNSLTAVSSPLIVVDGVIYNGALEDINPQDIESIDVLKDASAVAVYGSKSAGGVVAITTKKGKSGKPVINFNTNIGLATMEVNQPVYDPKSFMIMRQHVEESMHAGNAKPYQYADPRKLPADISVDQWLAYDGATGDPVSVWLQRLSFTSIEIANYKAGRSTNWYDLAFRNGLRQDYTISLSGRTEALSYYWSGGYEKNEGIIVGDEYNTIRSRLNLEGKVTRFLTVGINTQFADRDESAVPLNWGSVVNRPPYASLYNDDSTDYRRYPSDASTTGSNPFGIRKYTDRLTKYYTLNSRIYANVKLPFGINYQVNFTPRFEWYQYFNHQSSKWPDFADVGGTASREEHQIYQWQVDHLLTWNKTIKNDHHIEVTLLANAEKYNYWSNSMNASHFEPNDVLGYHNIGAGTVPPIISSNDEYSTGDALMARLFYSLKDRYLLTLSLRRDGYSAFGQRNPRASFPAAAAGWVFTQEPFFKSSWLNYGKLRFSYGVNGNNAIGRYDALSRLNSSKYLYVNGDGTLETVGNSWVGVLGNVSLKWEKTAAYNIGLDFSLLKDRLSGSLEAYKSQTTHLLVQRALPVTTGFDFMLDNLGEVDNKGIELSLNSLNMDRKNFSWNSSFNFSLNRNTIVHLYGNMVDILDENGKVIGQKETDDVSNRWFIGHAIDAVWDLRMLGIYQTGEEEAAAIHGQKPGDIKLQDVNGDDKYSNEDRQFLGYTEPRFRWTFRNEFTLYKQFSVSFMLYSYWGHMAVFNQAQNTTSGSALDYYNSYVFPYWTPDKPINDYARLYSNGGGASFNTYRKKSFIRLDNVALAYTFSQRLLQRASIKGLKVYFNVKNAAFYAPDWNYWDPENSGPTPRTYNLGINLTL